MPSNMTLNALLLGTFTIALLHALIPSHWLSFVLVGRSRRWPVRQTLRVAAMAGSGHVLTTVALGCLVASAGQELHQRVPGVLQHGVTSFLLIALGAYFAWPALRGRSCGHRHCGHAHGEVGDAGATGGDLQRASSNLPIVATLVLSMTLSPCLELLSVYLAASVFSWSALLAISGIMAATTLSVMLLLVYLTFQGLQHVPLAWLDRNEGLIVGVVLIALGALLFVI
ncbi:MAG: hypothetical protein RMJ43_02830 [Chloroherpetonaceae bacterium]|nr:hypothetical protein [Chthonomonadaceae bacterium]MDW8206743.1 hypothetical protein [Chloroherpetonaceae bacterium]